MIYKKRYGQPFDTESVVGSFLPMMETIPYLTKEPDGFSYAMEPQDILYGLGENVRGINKRGWVYESKCSDDGNHTEGKSSLYGAYNFMIVSGKDTFGAFIDYPGKVTFDCGYTDLDTLRITVAEENYDFYIIEGESLTDIVHQFRQLVGRSYIPPKWAFGNAQSRWSYMNEDEVREVVANYRANNMPLDAVVLDIDYMEHYKDFTVDAQRFPRFADFAAEMKAQGIHLVPIIDAGVKIEDGYDVYEEGVKNGYFCTNQDGTFPFMAISAFTPSAHITVSDTFVDIAFSALSVSPSPLSLILYSSRLYSTRYASPDAAAWLNAINNMFITTNTAHTSIGVIRHISRTIDPLSSIYLTPPVFSSLLLSFPAL